MSRTTTIPHRTSRRTTVVAGNRPRGSAPSAITPLELVTQQQVSTAALVQLRDAIDERLATTTTLRQACDRTFAQTGYRIGKVYPTQLRQILDGFAAFTPPPEFADLPTLPALPGFGDLPLSSLTAHAMEAFTERAREVIACRLIVTHHETLHTLNPRAHGHTAVWMIRLAARVIGRDLEVEELLHTNPMRHLKARKPAKSDPIEGYLSDEELREYCWLAVQAHPTDSELAAFVWVVTRLTCGRRGEIAGADLSDIDRSRNLLLLWGEKRTTSRWVPLPRPLIDALFDFCAQRPAKKGRRQPLLPTKRGGPNRQALLRRNVDQAARRSEVGPTASHLHAHPAQDRDHRPVHRRVRPA